MKNKYKILVTNDDGYEARGLLCLVEALRELPDVEVTVVAPANEKSACGHSLTLTRPLRFVGIEENFFKLEDGTPTDCVYLSLNAIFQGEKPDLVVSGINRGSNMGEDITYSGTAAGAMEGVLHNIPSIAISQVMDFTNPKGDFTLAQKTIKKIVTKIRNDKFPLPEREFLNINIPPAVEEAEIKTTYAGYRVYSNEADVHSNPRGEKHYWLGLHPLNFRARAGVKGVSDYEAIRDGFISVTPIMLDLSAYKSMKRLQEWLD
ncbi:5'/3'-nucleotidase SurE [Sulfurimonas sp. SWIR-19]|uniref:5'/3'-nucleotidase SurE n=1 Tax=Sulfurimonas sp. SWIR-19 TaxID=2878390 RepID=UPI001CF30B21|nr:5'/3'-nucleotidase SurE [Sulfurimonas sp. SWIR-19]UCN00934.1 5'/3'-nucleotidase SurE [Sulfurimonas sp. SWIR-19]